MELADSLLLNFIEPDEGGDLPGGEGGACQIGPGFDFAVCERLGSVDFEVKSPEVGEVFVEWCMFLELLWRASCDALDVPQSVSGGASPCGGKGEVEFSSCPLVEAFE